MFYQIIIGILIEDWLNKPKSVRVHWINYANILSITNRCSNTPDPDISRSLANRSCVITRAALRAREWTRYAINTERYCRLHVSNSMTSRLMDVNTCRNHWLPYFLSRYRWSLCTLIFHAISWELETVCTLVQLPIFANDVRDWNK